MSQLPGGNGNFWGGAWKGFMMGGIGGGVIGGAVGGIKASVNGKSFWTGKDLRPRVSVASSLKAEGVKLNDTKITNFDSKKINANVNNSSFEIAKREWMSVKQQYGIEQEFRGLPEGFERILPNGTKVTGQFYFGGTSNSFGYTIKITMELVKKVKIPSVYIRYKLPKPPFKP